MSSDEVFRVGVVLAPRFSLMAFASSVEPLRGANLVSGKTLYRWTHLSPEGGTVTSGGGLEVVALPLPAAPETEFDMIVVCGGLGSETYQNERLNAFLRRAARHNVIVGSLSTASFILASAKLLESRRCTVHWDYLEAFREKFPGLDVVNELFVIDRGTFTCAGGTVAMDVMLHLVRQRQGGAFASAVADQFLSGAMRQPGNAQRMPLQSRLEVFDSTVVSAVETMEGAIEHPLKLSQIARRVGVSPRQLERLFRRTLGCSPTSYYIRTRLERARSLLRHTTLSVLEVALSCGFTSPSHFTRAYRQHFKVVPSADRKTEILPFAVGDDVVRPVEQHATALELASHE